MMGDFEDAIINIFAKTKSKFRCSRKIFFEMLEFVRMSNYKYESKRILVGEGNYMSITVKYNPLSVSSGPVKFPNFLVHELRVMIVFRINVNTI